MVFVTVRRALSALVIASLCLTGFSTAASAGAGASVTAPADFSVTPGTCHALGTTTIAGFDSAQSLKLSIGGAGATTFKFNSYATGVTAAAGVSIYPGGAFGLVSFSGLQADLNEQLKLIQVCAPNTSGSDTVDIMVTIPGLTVDPATGHIYEVVSKSMNWTSAKADAATLTRDGMQGYLVTFGSKAETDFIAKYVKTNSWFGISDDYRQIQAAGVTKYTCQRVDDGGCAAGDAAEGHFYWVTGPEAGTPVSDGNYAPAAVGGIYTNWAPSEPNDYAYRAGSQFSGEYYGEVYVSGQLKWNDLPDTITRGAYIAEFGGMPGDTPTASTSVASDSFVVTYEQAPPTVTATASDVLEGDTTVLTATADEAVTWALSGTDAGLFNIDSSGNVTFKDPSVAGTYNITIEATSTGTSKVGKQDVTIKVVTDTTPPVVSGDAAPTITEGDTTVTTLSADESVTWSITDPTNGDFSVDASGNVTALGTLTPGTYNVTVRAEDAKGNFTDTVVTVVIEAADTTPPVVSGDTAPTITEGDTTVTTLSADESVTWSITDPTNGDFSVDASGNVTALGTLTPGTYNVTVRAEDAKGNFTDTVVTVVIEAADTTPPVVSGDTAPTIIEGNTTVTTLSADESVTWSITDPTNGDFSVDASGNVTALGTLTPGTYNVTVRAEDAKGNFTDTVVTVVIDFADQTAPVVTPGDTNPTITEGDTAVTTFTSDETVTWTVEDPTNGDFSIDASGNLTAKDSLAPGTYEVTVRAEDAAGNITDTVVTVVIDFADKTAPTVTPGDTNPTITEGDTAVTTLTADEDVTWLVMSPKNGNFKVDANGNLTAKSTLAPGTYKVTVRALDGAGNYTDTVVTVVIEPADQTAPVVTGDTEPFVEPGVTDVVSFTTDEPTTWSLDGTDAAAFTIDADGNLSFNETPAPGDYEVIVKATDAIGNVREIPVSVHVAAPAPVISVPATAEVVAPSKTIAAVTSDQVVEWAVTGFDGVSVDDNGNLVFAADSVAGTYTLTVTATNTDGAETTAEITVTVIGGGQPIQLVNKRVQKVLTPSLKKWRPTNCITNKPSNLREQLTGSGVRLKDKRSRVILMDKNTQAMTTIPIGTSLQFRSTMFGPDSIVRAYLTNSKNKVIFLGSGKPISEIFSTASIYFRHVGRYFLTVTADEVKAPLGMDSEVVYGQVTQVLVINVQPQVVNLHFQRHTAALSPEVKKYIWNHIGQLRAVTKIVLEGHYEQLKWRGRTESPALAHARAVAIRNYLVKVGVTANIVVFDRAGKKPIFETEWKTWKNRRVTMRVTF